MSTSISFRPDAEDLENLRSAMATGSSQSDVIRRGIALAAEEQRVMAAYDDLLMHFVSKGADPTDEDHAWAKRVSP